MDINALFNDFLGIASEYVAGLGVMMANLPSLLKGLLCPESGCRRLTSSATCALHRAILLLFLSHILLSADDDGGLPFLSRLNTDSHDVVVASLVSPPSTSWRTGSALFPSLPHRSSLVSASLSRADFRLMKSSLRLLSVGEFLHRVSGKPLARCRYTRRTGSS